jgi:hypothetical protein
VTWVFADGSGRCRRAWEPWLSPVCLTLAPLTLGHALQVSNGFYDAVALRWVTVAAVLSVLAVVSAGRTYLGESAVRTLTWLASVGIAWQVAALLTAPPGFELGPRANLAWFHAAIVAEAGLVACAVFRVRPLGRLWFPALLVVHLAAGVWLIRASPSPRIDVIVVHRVAIDALRRGEDPYRITFPSIYPPELGFYNPTIVRRGEVQFGYPYPPLSLMLALPGQILAGDYRYAELVAFMIGVACIGYLRAGILPKLAAALLLTTPRVFFVLEQGWTEPSVVMMLALTVFCLVRRPALAPWVGGLFVATKQYLIVAAILLARASRTFDRPARFLGTVTAAAAATIVPFALWHPHAFFESVVRLQTREPFRFDALSYLNFIARSGLKSESLAWSIAASAIALGIGCMRTPNTSAGLAVSLALASFAAFAFGPKAFCNYFFFVIAALCCALATVADGEGGRADHRTSSKSVASSRASSKAP